MVIGEWQVPFGHDASTSWLVIGEPRSVRWSLPGLAIIEICRALRCPIPSQPRHFSPRKTGHGG